MSAGALTIVEQKIAAALAAALVRELRAEQVRTTGEAPGWDLSQPAGSAPTATTPTSEQETQSKKEAA